MSWRRRNQRELESERDSVKERMFSLSDISHFSTKHARTMSRLAGRTMSYLAGTNSYIIIIRVKFATSLSDTCLAFIATLSSKKLFFKNVYQLNFFLLCNECVVPFHFLLKSLRSVNDSLTINNKKKTGFGLGPQRIYGLIRWTEAPYCHCLRNGCPSNQSIDALWSQREPSSLLI